MVSMRPKGHSPGLIVFLLAVSLLPVRAQDGDRRPQEADRPFRVEVEAVNVLATVHDKSTRRFVTELTEEDFVVYEDGRPQQITNFSQQTELPLIIALCVDTSSSVKLKLDFEKQAAIDFLFTVMRPVDRALLAEFDTGVNLLVDFTPNPNDLVQAIENLRAGGGTSLYDAIYLVSEQKLVEEPGRKVMVILSDGADLTSRRNFQDALRMVLQAEATVYAVSTTRFGADIDHEGDNALRQLTDNTGGQAFFPFSLKQLSDAFQEIDQELRSQYNLTYIPSNRRRDGTFRNIEVKVARDNALIRHKKGYFAPLDPE